MKNCRIDWITFVFKNEAKLGEELDWNGKKR